MALRALFVGTVSVIIAAVGQRWTVLPPQPNTCEGKIEYPSHVFVNVIFPGVNNICNRE